MRFLKPDTPLRTPTVRDLIPDYAWGWSVINMTMEEFAAMPVGEAAYRPKNFEEVIGAAYRANTARYGEKVGAWYVARVIGFSESNTHYEFLMINVDGEPLIEDFSHDPYHNLALRKERNERADSG